jgi:hypothetical protein
MNRKPPHREIDVARLYNLDLHVALDGKARRVPIAQIKNADWFRLAVEEFTGFLFF